MNDEADVPRKRGRPRKTPFVSILPREVIEGLQTPAQLAEREQREKERQRGIARRAEKKVLDSMSEAETIQEFWAESQKLADPVKLAEWKARSEYVEALLGDIRTVLEGRAPDEEFAQDVDDEIQADVAEFGEAGATPILLIGKFWQDPNLLAQLTSGETPSAIFAKFGILTALPDIRVYRWQEFIVAHRATSKATETATPSSPNGNGYVALTCGCNSPTSTESVQQSVAEAYQHQGKRFLCGRCREQERKSREQPTIFQRGLYTPGVPR